MRRFAVTFALMFAVPAFAEEWETIQTSPMSIKTRERPGTRIREIWAEGEMGASVRDIQSAILDSEAYPKFMPYLKECRYIGTPDPDGAKYVYTKLDLPWVTSRDYVVRVHVPQKVADDGSGTFENRWEAVPDKIPSRANIVRLRVNEGSWLVTPKPDGTSHVVYKFVVDPGGMIPGFAANIGNKGAVSDTFKAVEDEAKKRQAARVERTGK